MESFDVKLLRRAIGRDRIHQSIRPLYGDKVWAEDLDIVNELGGHTGCVNALSWSTTGGLLASGSDDHHINIWDYNPSNLAKPFSLNTSVSTGHTGNIFSVKFMPYSGDRTVVSCAADSQVRVFDLEYSASTSSAVDDTVSIQSRRFSSLFPTARWLNEPSTNAKVYRSHSDRAKRIVTESSPFIFLSCSEDGEVRQWDLRLPSSAYPPSRSMRRRYNQHDEHEQVGNSPPALISYKQYALDLNTISCSRSQPHYIALGGSHLHCFLHDRRMLGRDISHEYGHPGSRLSSPNLRDENMMREATKCVKRFAPNNQRKMNPGDRGHITACKISDARPNELISSWSGDHIYSFDIIRSPDVGDAPSPKRLRSKVAKLTNKSYRKRKRMIETQRAQPSASSQDEMGSHVITDQAELRVTFNDGATQDLSLSKSASTQVPRMPSAIALNDIDDRARKIAQAIVQLRRTLFGSLPAHEQRDSSSQRESTSVPLPTELFTNALGLASDLLLDIQDASGQWTYPINPSSEEVAIQNTLRYDRQNAWRFVQAAGCISKTLGGELQTLNQAPDPRLIDFSQIRPAPREDNPLTPALWFDLDFLRAILLWLDGGITAILNGFQAPIGSRNRTRYPFDQDDTENEVPNRLQHYLLNTADTEEAIIDIGTSRFEQRESRSLFHSQSEAVLAFTTMLSESLQPNLTLATNHEENRVLWGHKVGRALLLGAAEGVDYVTALRAFGGPKVSLMGDSENLGHVPHIISDNEERVITSVQVVEDHSLASMQTSLSTSQRSTERNDGELADAPIFSASEVDIHGRLGGSGSISESSDDEEENEDENSDSEADSTESESDSEPTHPLLRHTTSSTPRKDRSSVNARVPYASHSKVYKGHCNVQTVKDVNYYGLDDEYVVSGSDDGHLFIWDRKTCQIVNILEGDGEIVNVVQGHPHEPMIACSGIDSTIKIFGSGGNSRERYDAAVGKNIANSRGTTHSSLRRGGRSRRSNESVIPSDQSTSVSYEDDQEPIVIEDGLKSRRALRRQYEITSNNDDMRRRREEDPVMTEGMLARLALILQQGGTIPGVTTEDGTIVIDQENCSIM